MMKKIDMEKVKYIQMGREAYQNGQPRTPPTEDPEISRIWLVGYDIEKRFTEDEVLTSNVQ